MRFHVSPGRLLGRSREHVPDQCRPFHNRTSTEREARPHLGSSERRDDSAVPVEHTLAIRTTYLVPQHTKTLRVTVLQRIMDLGTFQRVDASTFALLIFRIYSFRFFVTNV